MSERSSEKGDSPKEESASFQEHLSLQQSLHTFPGLSKVIPLVQEGFFSRLFSLWYFGPAFATVLVGLVLLALLQLLLHTNWIGYLYAYEVILGLYFGGLTIFGIVRIANVSLPLWLVLLPACLTALLLWWQLPFTWLSFVLVPAPIHAMSKSSSLFPAFVGSFFSAGLVEELFKSIPVWLFLGFSAILSRRRDHLFIKGRMHPLVAVVIGVASAVGFILVETLLGYVPMLQQQTNSLMGMMLLIPRLLTGICGHVAWAGIFAYFIGLSRFYKWRGALLLLFFGWVVSASLHGLWNACQQVNIPITGAVVALTAFVMFVAYLYKAKEFFSQPAVQRVFAESLTQVSEGSLGVEAQGKETKRTSTMATLVPFQTLMFGRFGEGFIPEEEGDIVPVAPSSPKQSVDQTMQLLLEVDARELWGVEFPQRPDVLENQAKVEATYSPEETEQVEPIPSEQASNHEQTIVEDHNHTLLDIQVKDLNIESHRRKKGKGDG